MSHSIFDNAGEPTGQRFRRLETLYHPWTIRDLSVPTFERTAVA